METCFCYIILAENFFAYSLLVMYCSQGKNAHNNFVKTKRTLKSWMKKCEDNINVYFSYKCFDRLVFVNQMKSIFTQFYIQYYRTNILQEVNALAFEFRIVLGGGEWGHGRRLEQYSTSLIHCPLFCLLYVTYFLPRVSVSSLSHDCAICRIWILSTLLMENFAHH